jgi:hypothetical protein
MIADIYTTLQAIIYDGFPKNNQSKPVVFDEPIIGWYQGDRSLITETPGIVFQGQPSTSKDVGFATKEYEHKILISCWHRSDGNALLEQKVLEFTRLIHEVILPHRRIWVLAKCPLCPLSSKKILTKWSLSPEHFIIGHSGILGNFSDIYSASGTNSYVANAKHNADLIWQQTHNTGYSGFVNSGLAVGAFNLMYEDVRSGYSVSGMSLATSGVISSYQSNKIRPIRIITDCVLSDIKPVTQDNEKNLFRGGEFLLTCKERITVPGFGPDNVSTTLWG